MPERAPVSSIASVSEAMALHSLKRGVVDLPRSEMMSAESNSRCPVCRTADVVCGKWTLLVIRDLAEGSQPLLRARALAGGDQPADPLAAPAGAGRGGHRRAQHLPRGAAAGRVRADREGRGAGAADRGHAPLRQPLAARRRGRAEPVRRLGRRPAAAFCKRTCRRRSGAGPGMKRVGVRDPLLNEALTRLAAEAAIRFSIAGRGRRPDPLRRRRAGAARRPPSTATCR